MGSSTSECNPITYFFRMSNNENKIPLCNLPWRKRFSRENFQSLSQNQADEKIESHNLNSNPDLKKDVRIVPGVIRHTSHPTHSLAYYFKKPLLQEENYQQKVQYKNSET